MTQEQKEAKKLKDKEYREKNKEKIKAWREANKERLKEYRKKYYEENKEEILNYQKETRDPESNKERCREYRERNLERLREYDRQRRKEGKKRESDNRYKNKRRKNDSVFRMNHCVGNAIYKHLMSKRLKKNNRKWESIVGYTLQELKTHLESKFKEGMTWDNYGNYWHIDHIRPKSWFVFESMDDPAFKECWALSNLQPLEATLNVQKSNLYEG